MDFAVIVNALGIPAEARVDRRVPKKLMLEQGAPTTADKRQIQDGIEEMTWIAALKPTTIGVPVFKDDLREYLEIAVLTVILREKARSSRLVALIHRAIPYPLMLVTADGRTVSLSCAHKRWSQGELGKIVIEEVFRTDSFQLEMPSAEQAAFLVSLRLSALPNSDLFALYQGWIDRMTALEAAQITGTFNPPESAERAAAMRAGLDAHARLQRDLAGLRAQAVKEKQINRRVELNLEIKRLEGQLAEAIKKL